MPTLKITKREVDSLPLTEYGKQRFYWDTELKGFGLRVGHKAKAFIVQKDMNGKTRRATIGRYGTWTVDEARREAREQLLQMDKGVDIVAEKREKAAQQITLEQAWKIHKASLVNKNAAARTIEIFEQHLAADLAKFKNRSLADISRSEVRELHSKLGKRGIYVANNTLRSFRAIYNAAMKENEYLPPNPCVAIQWFKEYRRQEPIAEEKLAEWYEKVKALPNSIRSDYHLFVIFTGLRRTDSCTIRWEDIDMQKATLHRPNPKGGKERAFTIPLPDICIEILERRQDENAIIYGKHCAWVFPTLNNKGEVVAMQEPKENKRGLPSPHRLRDTYTTACNTVGISAYDIEVLTNHRPANNSVTAGYVSQSIEHLRAQQQKVADYLKAKMRIA